MLFSLQNISLKLEAHLLSHKEKTKSKSVCFKEGETGKFDNAIRKSGGVQKIQSPQREVVFWMNGSHKGLTLKRLHETKSYCWLFVLGCTKYNHSHGVLFIFL